MSQVKSIENSITYFRQSVKKLGGSIGNCGATWNDEKFQTLFSHVQAISQSTREVLEHSEKLTQSAREFSSAFNS